MYIRKLAGCSLLLFACNVHTAYTQTTASFTSISLNDLSAFRDPGANWVIASDAAVDYTVRGDMKPVPGTGAVVNEMSEKNRSHLFTKEEWGDVELELDFMMANYSNSGVYLQGRYEIQLLDSWTRLPVTSSDCGGIYQRWKQERGSFEGTAPNMNVARAPGLWQHLRIKFRAPKFNSNGEKTANAIFEEVYLNNVLVQQQAQVTGPTTSAMYANEKDEKATGPLVLQGDHGKVAFRNIRYRYLPPPDTAKKEIDYWQTRNSIIVTPSLKPSFIKTFLEHGNKKLTHVLSVGHPNQVNYSYDLKTGALFQVWRGDYLDVTKSWEERGGEQLATPLGSVISLSDAPVVAVLNSEATPWTDSVTFEEVDNKGYVLNKQRSPVFEYIIKGIHVKDSIVVPFNGEGLVRTIKVINPSNNLYCLITKGSDIQMISPGLYVADNKSYYIKINSKYNPVIRQSGKGKELIVKYNAEPVTYSLIW
ncbi:MAG: 3-keto-disaccharide hydrolase [Agriterribacter sp.]